MDGARAESVARGRGRAKEKSIRQLTVAERAFIDKLVRTKKKSPTEALRQVNHRRQKKQVREVEKLANSGSSAKEPTVEGALRSELRSATMAS